MLIPEYRNTLNLTHYGRRSHTVYNVTVWFVVLDGEVWIGSLDRNKNWVRNLKATGRARIDFGEGPQTVSAEYLENPADVERHRKAVFAKYPTLSRLIALTGFRKKRAAFRLKPVDPLSK